MTTLGQELANRENCQKSTGPTSDDGKRIAAMNAVRHGMCGAVVPTKGEDAEAFKVFADGYRVELDPQTVEQMELAERIIGYVWLVRRAGAIEAALWNSSGGSVEDMAVMLGTHAKELSLCLRYSRENERKLTRAREEYRKLKEEARRAVEAVAHFELAAKQGKDGYKRRKEEEFWAVEFARMAADEAEGKVWNRTRKDGTPYHESQAAQKQAWHERFAQELAKAREKLGRRVGQLLTDSYYEEEAAMEAAAAEAEGSAAAQ